MDASCMLLASGIAATTSVIEVFEALFHLSLDLFGFYSSL